MKNVIFLFLFILTSIVHAQKNIQLYYSHTNTAELCIVKENYKEALSEYRKAFTYSTPRATDVYNSIILALELDNIDLAIAFSEKLICKGVPLIFFKQQSLKKMVYSPKWQKFVTKKYPKLEKKTQKKLNIALKNKIVELFKRDQKHRVHYNKDSLSDVDSENGIILNTIFDEFGYPNEEVIGVWMRNDTTFEHWNPLDILLIHQVDYKDRMFLKRIKNFAMEGSMPSIKLLNFSDRIREDSSFLFGIDYYMQNIFIQIGDNLYTCDDKTIKR
jgi:hypothetical protein